MVDSQKSRILLLQKNQDMIPFYLTRLDRFEQLSTDAAAKLGSNQKIVKFKANCKKFFPDEISDFDMICFPEIYNIDYCTLLDYEKDGFLPDDLTHTEIVLTKVLHGEMAKDYACLLVSAIENMDIKEVSDQVDKLFCC